MATKDEAVVFAAHRCASMGNRAIAETVIPAAPATTPSRARNDAASSSATADREVATAPQITAATPKRKPSPTTQNDATDSAPRAIDTAGNRDPRCFRIPVSSRAEHMWSSAPELSGTAAVMIL